MKFFSPLIIIFVFTAGGLAQVPHVAVPRIDSIAPTKSANLNFSIELINSRIDTIQLRANSFASPNLSANNVIRRFKLRANARDTLHARHELDSVKGTLQHKIDSLSNLNLPTNKYKRRLDSISNINPQEYLKQVQARREKLETTINKPISDIEDKVNEKLALMNKEGRAAANLPGSMKVDDLKLPDVDTKLDLGGKDLKIPAVDDLNPLNKIDNPVSEQMEQVGEWKDKFDEVKSIPQQQIDRVKSIDEVQAVQAKAGEANALIDKGQAYGEDIKNIANGDLGEVKAIPEAIENKVASLDEMKELQKYNSEISQYQDMIAKGNDPEAVKALAKQQALKYAKDHFAGKEAILQGAMSQMSKLKSKFPELSSMKDLPRFVPNQMKGKPLIERIVPGFAFQIQKGNTFMIDLSPTVAYRVTGRFSTGIGWNERISFSEWNKTVAEDRIYGPRLFTAFELKKGFSLKAEVEKMSVLLPTFTGATERERAWVWSVFVGIKKEYTFYKNVKGNVQILYNIYDDHDNSPYVDRLNVRMGWEFPMKKKSAVGSKQSAVGASR